VPLERLRRLGIKNSKRQIIGVLHGSHWETSQHKIKKHKELSVKLWVSDIQCKRKEFLVLQESNLTRFIALPELKLTHHRDVKVHDAPFRGNDVWIKIKKRRFYCKHCKKPFTEPVSGVRKGKRTTERFRRSLSWACENFSDLEKVKKAYRCSNWLVYQTLYEHLEINLKRHLNYPWPKTIGIDEHFFSRKS